MYTFFYRYTLSLFLVDSKLDPTLKKQSRNEQAIFSLYFDTLPVSLSPFNETRSDFEKAISSTFHIPTKWTATTGTIYIFPLLRYSLFLVNSKLDPKKQSPPHFVFQAKLAARTIYIFVTPSAHQLATKLDLIFEKRQSPPQSNNLYFTSILFSLLSKLDPKRAISSTFHIPQCGRKPAAGTIISIRKNFPSFPSFLPSFLPSVPEGLRSRQEVASVDAIIPLSSSSFFLPRFTISIRSYCHEKRRIEATHEKKNAWIFFFRDLFPFSLSLYKVQVYGAQYAWLPPPVDLRFFSLKGPRVDIDRSCARTRNPSLLFSVPIPFLVIFFVRLAATNLLIEKILFQIFLILKSRITYHRNKLEKFYNNNSGQRNSFKLVSFPMEDKFM